jgi:MSHA biogenesis protein MshO
MSARAMPAAQRGFTLVEAIIAIVIIGVLGAMVAVFIRLPVQGYADSVLRAELTDTADLALRRMARDLRLALPNSIRVNPTQDAIEFLITKDGGRYLAADDGVATLPVLDFLDPAQSNPSFTVVGAMPSRIVAGQDYLVVNNLGPGFEPANAYALTQAQRNIARIVGVGANTISLDANPFGAQSPPLPSANQRFYIVGGPVTYACGLGGDGTRSLTRQSGYPIALAQLDNPVAVNGSGGERHLLAARVASCTFEYGTMANQRSALIILTLALQPRESGAATVRLVHQIHVDNTP